MNDAGTINATGLFRISDGRATMASYVAADFFLLAIGILGASRSSAKLSCCLSVAWRGILVGTLFSSSLLVRWAVPSLRYQRGYVRIAAREVRSSSPELL